MPEIICRGCGRRYFQDWGELAQHINSAKDVRHKNKASKLWAKRYIHKNAINKLKKIGQKKQEYEPHQALTEEQLESKREAKYTLSGQKEFVYVVCPNQRCENSKKAHKEAIEIEHTRNPNAWKIGNCYPILCESCR